MKQILLQHFLEKKLVENSSYEPQKTFKLESLQQWVFSWFYVKMTLSGISCYFDMIKVVSKLSSKPGTKKQHVDKKIIVVFKYNKEKRLIKT